MFKKKANFLGRQIARVRRGILYASIIMNALNTSSLIIMAFAIDISYAILLIPAIILMIFMIGFVMDKSNINSYDMIKDNDMSCRYLLTSDVKNFEFQKLTTEILLLGMSKMMKNEVFDFEKEFAIKYDEFIKKWSPK